MKTVYDEVTITLNTNDNLPRIFFFVSKWFPKLTKSLVAIGYWKAYRETQWQCDYIRRETIANCAVVAEKWFDSEQKHKTKENLIRVIINLEQLKK